MSLPKNKTKIVATIGPASSSVIVLEQLILAGMNVARLNFSHGDFSQHASVVANIRAASATTGRRVAIMADLPGPKMRLGEIPNGPIDLHVGDSFILTSQDGEGDARRVSMSFDPLPRVVRPGDRLFLNDGLVQLLVDEIIETDVRCTVVVGGPISSRKGLNLPRIKLGIRAFTDRDRECLEFALSQGVDAISQSFVESAADIEAVREAANACGHHPFLIAKIERYEALERYEEILAVSDGIMVARGDLGVEVPIEDMAVIQKDLIAKANLAGKPVITATQMLESMTTSRLPTRAEATDVANAILDGTDCVMLSGESAMGAYPVEAVSMLAKIAISAENHRVHSQQPPAWKSLESSGSHIDKKSQLVENAIRLTDCDLVCAPTRSGNTARAVARWRPSVWILAMGPIPAAMQGLAFSAGVFPVDLPEDPEDWTPYLSEFVESLGIPCQKILLITGPSVRNPTANQRLELIHRSR